MKKTGLVCILFFTTQFSFASFPQSGISDTSQSCNQSGGSSSRNLLQEQEADSIRSHLSFTKKRMPGFPHSRRRNFATRKPNWTSVVGGFILGFWGGPVGFGISRLTKNKALRKGASLGFTVLLILATAYFFLELFILLLRGSL